MRGLCTLCVAAALARRSEGCIVVVGTKVAKGGDVARLGRSVRGRNHRLVRNRPYTANIAHSLTRPSAR